MTWCATEVQPGDSVSFKYRGKDLVDAKVVQVKDYGEGQEAMLDCSNGRVVCTKIRNLLPPRSVPYKRMTGQLHQSSQQMELFAIGGAS